MTFGLLNDTPDGVSFSKTACMLVLTQWIEQNDDPVSLSLRESSVLAVLTQSPRHAIETYVLQQGLLLKFVYLKDAGTIRRSSSERFTHPVCLVVV